ncbi:hypothetical protein ABZ890_41805 [Streptomyces sp. NPDC046984]
MRYPDEDGLIAERRKRRDEVRMRAADLLEEDVKSRDRLGVTGV